MKIKHNPINAEKRLQEEIIGGTENPKSNYFITEEKKLKVIGTNFFECFDDRENAFRVDGCQSGSGWEDGQLVDS